MVRDHKMNPSFWLQTWRGWGSLPRSIGNEIVKEVCWQRSVVVKGKQGTENCMYKNIEAFGSENCE